MRDLRQIIQSYYVTSYDVLCNTVDEMLVRNDVTQSSLWVVLFIIAIISSLIILFKRKHDELFSLPEETLSMPADRAKRRTEVNHMERDPPITCPKKLLAELHYATSKCYDIRYASKCIRLVRDCPYLVNVSPEPSGLTPFQLVCYHGHACLVEYMLAKGANPQLTTQSGENALCLAIYHCIKNPKEEDLTCLDVLYSSGCTLDPRSRWFKVVLKMAMRNSHKRLTEWILVHAKSIVHKHRSMSVPSALENIENYNSRYGHSLKR